MRDILCSISTRGRYDTTLPLAIAAVINQTRKVDKLIVYDDNDTPRDVREIHHYASLLNIMNVKGIEFEWVYAGKKGQHYNHQMANTAGYTWVWRVDDDCIPESNVLENLYGIVNESVGAVGGAILTPPYAPVGNPTGKIVDIYKEQNIQWNPILEFKDVDHLHCSFLYRAGVIDYNLGLSRVAHREETLFTYGLVQKGLRCLVVPGATTWHMKANHGGIRTEQAELFAHDEQIFQNIIGLSGKTIVVLDCGLGDHIVFSHVLSDIKNPVIFTCYQEVVPGDSIQKAKDLFGDIGCYNIYRKMDQWKWKGSLEEAFRKLYL